jgi:hypothetical protein
MITMRPRTLLKYSVLLLAGATLTAAAHRNQETGADRRAVELAVEDYVDALYLVDPSRIDRSVHPDLTKLGFHRRNSEAPFEEMVMSFQELRDLSAGWNASGAVNPETAPREITVLDVSDQTASAKLVADWGVDYLHLARYDGRWKIIQVLWQSPPTAR